MAVGFCAQDYRDPVQRSVPVGRRDGADVAGARARRRRQTRRRGAPGDTAAACSAGRGTDDGGSSARQGPRRAPRFPARFAVARAVRPEPGLGAGGLGGRADRWLRSLGPAAVHHSGHARRARGRQRGHGHAGAEELHAERLGGLDGRAQTLRQVVQVGRAEREVRARPPDGGGAPPDAPPASLFRDAVARETVTGVFETLGIVNF